ncbi:hypothetical protein G4V62_05510 [Bacillaceae bacterium SIJ1]|uniref:hypothetical protein n=1 Tax=Litoribacterium kuwaitense TaxID=1398745 RepID=UPI0013ECF4A5|nr:hypothetical protein [Litoribacterium kuwaitense]NGP44438.1 hypothetical protein [Litoribacterium kuwaitense]
MIFRNFVFLTILLFLLMGCQSAGNAINSSGAGVFMFPFNADTTTRAEAEQTVSEWVDEANETAGISQAELVRTVETPEQIEVVVSFQRFSQLSSSSFLIPLIDFATVYENDSKALLSQTKQAPENDWTVLHVEQLGLQPETLSVAGQVMAVNGGQLLNETTVTLDQQPTTILFAPDVQFSFSPVWMGLGASALTGLLFFFISRLWKRRRIPA